MSESQSGYDQKCYDLALHFLTDKETIKDKKWAAHKLSQRIQHEIENWLEWAAQKNENDL